MISKKKPDSDIFSILSKEENQLLKRQVRENWIYAIAIILGLLTVFALGKWNFDKLIALDVISGTILIVLIALLSFLFFVVIHYLTRNVFEKIYSKVYLQNVRKTIEWSNDWKGTADRALDILEKEAIKSHLLVFHPEKYTDFLISEGRKDSEHSVSSITLTGSMVGFYVIISKALQNFLCANSNLSNTVNILGTNKKYDTEKYSRLAYFSYAFVIKTLDFIINGDCNRLKEIKGKSHLSLKFNIQFCEFDFLNASILIGDNKIAILQALNAPDVDKIVDDGIQLGMMVKKETDPNFPLGKLYFERYKEVIDGWRKDIKQTENWTIKANSENISLEISNAYWNKDVDQNNLEKFDSIPLPPYDTTDKVKEFLLKFQDFIKEKADTSDLDENKNLINRFDKIKCKCHH